MPSDGKKRLDMHTTAAGRWWQTGVVYQIYPRSFQDSNGDGVGDLQGIINRLDYLQWLGINAIWISPIYPSPMADFGYDVANYTDIHEMFGDLATFDRLVAEAHQRDIRVILDFVPNHTSDEHPWFVESRSSRDNSRRDWYIWKDAQPDGSPPNNWVSAFGGKAWTWDETTGQYYLHLFLNKQPDLNWRNPEVVAAMHDVLRFWLDRGVDGFRMDVVSYIIKDPAFRSNPVREASNGGLGEWVNQEHRYDTNQPEVHDYLRGFRRVIEEYDDRVTIGEIWEFDRAKWVQYYGKDLDELHLPFNFDLLNKPWQAAAFRASVEELEAEMPEHAQPNYVMGSHDISRLATRYGRQAVRVAAMLLLTLRGTPTIYLGEELGMEDGVIPPDRVQDPQGVGLGDAFTRDVCRTPFQWSGEAFAGFSDHEPWLPVADGYETRNVEMQRSDPRSVLNLYRQLLSLRAQHPALHGGDYESVSHDNPDAYLYQRSAGNERMLVALNFGDQPLEVGDLAGYRVMLSTEMDRDEGFVDSCLLLRPYEGVILQSIE